MSTSEGEQTLIDDAEIPKMFDGVIWKTYAGDWWFQTFFLFSITYMDII